MTSSWQLLHELTAFRQDDDNPVFRREMAAPPVWKRLAPSPFALAGAGACVVVIGLRILAGTPLGLIFPVVPLLLHLLIALALAPVITRERGRGTWAMLRATPYRPEDLLLGKAAGALSWLRGPFRNLSALLLVVGIGTGFLSLIATVNAVENEPLGLPTPLLCGATVLLPMAAIVVFIADRLQQIMLVISATLALSASTSSLRTALTGAGVLALIIWLADIGLGLVLLTFNPDWLTGPLEGLLLPLATLGPFNSFLLALPLGPMVLATALTLTLREIAIRGLWAWAIRAARQL